MESRKGRENPFSRPDRIHFPVMSRSMWEFPLNDSFGTPQLTSGLSSEDLRVTNAASPATWTPHSNDLSWFTPADSQGIDAFFQERERCGLLTPARSPIDFLQRGSLFDPFSQSGRTSDSSNRGSSNRSKVSEPFFTPSSPSGTPDMRTNWSGSQKIVGHRGGHSNSELVSPSKRHHSPIQSRTSETKRKYSLVRSSSEFSASPIKRTPETSNQCETGLPRLRPSVGLPPSGMFPKNPNGDRDPDSSLSVSSISFGRGDMRVHASEGLGVQTATLAARLRNELNLQKSSQNGAQASTQKETIARQLDFGADTAGLPQAAMQISQYSTMTHSDMDSVDWESSLVHEATEESQALALRRSCEPQLTPGFPLSSPGFNLKEFSPLCSVSGLSSCPAFVSPDSVLSRAGAFPPDRECPTWSSPSNGVSSLIHSTLGPDRPLHVSVENISNCSDSGGVLLQLRVSSQGGLDRSLQTASAPAEVSQPQPLGSSFHNAMPESFDSLSQMPDSRVASGQTVSKASQTDSVALQDSFSRLRECKSEIILSRTESKACQTEFVDYSNSNSRCSQGRQRSSPFAANRSTSAPQLCRSVSVPAGRTSSACDDDFLWSLSKYETSVEDLRCMVQDLHDRYLQQCFQVKPMRYRRGRDNCMYASWDRCNRRRRCANGWSRSRR